MITKDKGDKSWQVSSYIHESTLWGILGGQQLTVSSELDRNVSGRQPLFTIHAEHVGDCR